MELTVTGPAELRLPERLGRAALAALRRDVEALRKHGVAVVRGASDDVFCRGMAFDGVEAGAGGAGERDAGLADFEAAALALVTAPTATVARVAGDAAGGGLGVACACDVVVADAGARFALPEPLFGLVPGLILPLVRTRIGSAALRRLALGGDSVDAAEALRLGLVDEVAEPGTLDERVARWTRRLARAERGAVGRLKGWLAEMDGLAAEAARGRRHLAELLSDPEVLRRVGRYQRGLAPWGDDG